MPPHRCDTHLIQWEGAVSSAADGTIRLDEWMHCYCSIVVYKEEKSYGEADCIAVVHSARTPEDRFCWNTSARCRGGLHCCRNRILGTRHYTTLRTQCAG